MNTKNSNFHLNTNFYKRECKDCGEELGPVTRFILKTIGYNFHTCNILPDEWKCQQCGKQPVVIACPDHCQECLEKEI